MSISSEYGESRKKERLNRERLFKKSRPFIRPFDIEKDAWIVWAAYDLKSFPQIPDNLNPNQFLDIVRGTVKSRSAALVIEDDCKYFKSGRGPVCLVLVDNYGWQIQPFVDFFYWATPRIKLRTNVAFFQKIRHDSAVGICLVKSGEKTANLFNRMSKYGVLWKCGKIPSGREDGDEFLYQVRGKKNAGTHGVRQHSEVQRDDRVERPANPSPKRDSVNPNLPRPAAVPSEQRREEVVVSVQPSSSNDKQRESNPPTVDVELRQARIRDWA